MGWLLVEKEEEERRKKKEEEEEEEEEKGRFSYVTYGTNMALVFSGCGKHLWLFLEILLRVT